MEHKIGDIVWFVQNTYKEHKVTCQDCFGDLCLTVIMGDGSKVSIPCAGCGSHTYGQYSRGYNVVHQYEPKAISGRITGIVMDREETEYRIAFGGGSYYAPKAVYATEAEALPEAVAMAEAQTVAALTSFQGKERPTRDWSWNATYHRGQVRDAERALAYHKSKLEVAKSKAKPSETVAR